MTSETTKLDLDSRSLVSGRVVIEASAGTGKTYALTVLAVRHIAETELTADHLLMVTFTKAATAELRHKTRERAQEAVDCLRTGKQTEPWMNSMFASPETMAKAEKKLNAFISQFDETTITTIHGFCQIVLSRLGLNSPAPANYTVQNNIENIIDQSITDALASRLSKSPALLYGRKNKKTPKGEPQQYHDFQADELSSSLNALKEATKKIVGNSGALMLPQKQPSIFATNRASISEAEIETLELAERIAEEATTIVADVRRRCQDLQIITYDDMVRLVAQTLNPLEASGEQLHTAAKVIASVIANQYQMIMVDEFQDTDLSQWSIFKKIYESDSDNLTLVTVGDPKQSIYRFRGADVQVYLDAVKPVIPSYELTTNHRSDGALLSALDTLLLGTQFDVAGDVKFKSVDPSSRNEDTRVGSKTEQPVYKHVPGAPLELRYLSNDPDLGAGETPGKRLKDGKLGEPKKNNNDGYQVRRIFWRDTCNHIVELLSDGLIPDKKSELPDKSRAIKPSDIAILVNSHRDAETAVNYLRDSGVPAVRLKTNSVFGSMAAMHWLMFLGAIANPGKPQFVRAFALSWFGSSSNEDLLTASNDDIAAWQRECAESSELLRKRGFAALYLSFRNSTNFLGRILGEPDGERHITDLDHLAEILTSMPRFARKVGATECFKTLQDLVEEHDDQNEEHLRRIEGDDDAVKVMTIHTSKGLQFPIVFLPTLHKKPNSRGNNPGMFSYKFDGEITSRRIIDVASGFENAKKWILNLTKEKSQTALWKNEFKVNKVEYGREVEAKKDRFSESMRLIYVALTRAEHKVIAYWSAEGEDNNKGNINVALAKVLIAHDKTLSRIPTEREALDNLMTSISKKSGGTIAAIALRSEKVDPLVWAPNLSEKLATKIDVATFTRNRESVRLYGFARWSYSGISKALKGEKVDGSGDGAPGTDESNPVVEEADQINESINLIEPLKQNRDVDVHIKTEDAIAAMPLFAGVAGASFGVAVHKVYKEIDPSKIDIEKLIAEEVATQFDSWSEEVDKSKISDGIIKSIDSPLGAEFGGKTLRSLGAADRLAELSFDFRLAQDKAFKLSEIGNLMLKHGDLDEELLILAQRLNDLGSDNQQVAGFMTGSIDAVFRIIDDKNNARYIVTDYKTNQLHDPKAENVNPLISYHPENLLKPMIREGFILQILVYTVALHRYLKWRQPEYDPEKHLGGSAYFFIRGMIGFETNESPARPYGVFFWRPPTKLILALDALFAGRPH